MKTWFINLKTRTKLIAYGVVSLTLILLITIVSLIRMYEVDRRYTVSEEALFHKIDYATFFMEDLIKLNAVASEVLANQDDAMEITRLKDEAEALIAELETVVDELNAAHANGDDYFNPQATEILEAKLAEYKQSVLSAADYFIDRNRSAALSEIQNSIAISEVMTAELDSAYKAAIDDSMAVSDANTEYIGETILIIIVVILLSTIILVLATILVSWFTAKPIRELSGLTKQLAEGDLSVKLALNSRDEIGVLSRDIESLADVFRTIDQSIRSMSSDFENGEIDSTLDIALVKGDYQGLMTAVNMVVEGLSKDILNAVGMLEKFVMGDFHVEIKGLPGKKAVLSNALTSMQENLKNVAEVVVKLSEAGAKGRLDERADVSVFKGDWHKLTTGMNDMFTAIAEPIEESVGVLSNMENGDLSQRIKREYSGSFGRMKNAINNMSDGLSGYVSEISSILTSIAAKDLNIKIEQNYTGDFLPIRVALETITESLNKVMQEISSSAEQVSIGARQVTESSMSLATGAVEQMNAVTELENTLQGLSVQTAHNAESTKNAEKLASSAKTNAESGNKEMSNMLEAMKEINTSSRDISKIIKVIDDIAFQTNLLALNAAVEAAHAGVHGVGFAVVAEQVRTLAGRSLEAAKDTTTLIEGSNEKVNQGMLLANQTAQKLGAMVGQITEISELIVDIAESSQQQSVGISEINKKLMSISAVTQANSASSEEGAASAEEMSSQAEVFKSVVGEFKLKAKDTGISEESVKEAKPDNNSKRELSSFVESQPRKKDEAESAQSLNNSVPSKDKLVHNEVKPVSSDDMTVSEKEETILGEGKAVPSVDKTVADEKKAALEADETKYADIADKKRGEGKSVPISYKEGSPSDFDSKNFGKY